MGRAEGTLSGRSVEGEEILNRIHHGATEDTEERFFCLPGETGKQKDSTPVVCSGRRLEGFWRIVTSRFSRKPFSSVHSVFQTSPLKGTSGW